MPDIKSNLDRIALATLGLAAVAVSLIVLGWTKEAKDAASLAAPPASKEPFVGDPAVALLKSDRSALLARKSWEESKSSPFVSRIYLLKEGQLVDILETGNDLFPGIPNAWILEHNLDYLDEGLPGRDPDKDGFTNLEEYADKTNPRDANSKPQEWTKFRVDGVKIEQLQLIFTGRDPKGRASINSVAASSDALKGKPIGPTRNYAIGDTVIVTKYRPGFAVTYEEEKTPFRLVDFRTEQRQNDRITVDGKPKIDEVLFAVLESTIGDKTKAELEVGKAEISPYSLASLTDTRPGGTSVEVRAGDSFQLGSSTRYKLIDVSEQSATIMNLATGEKHTVPRSEQSTPPAAPTEEAQAQ